MAYPQHIVAVSALITNTQGEVLMILSPKRGWEIPGGQVEVGEDLISALQREVIEETGVTIRVQTMTGVYSNIKSPSKVIFAFQAEYVGGALIRTDESLQTEWVATGQVLERITHPAIADRVQDMLSFAGAVVYRVYTTDPYERLKYVKMT
ncbi:MAG: NUDIX hydrolase [Anaerolineales bacterium]|nr:NUDIX hydrolase [Anaerolineales bacterium]